MFYLKQVWHLERIHWVSVKRRHKLGKIITKFKKYCYLYLLESSNDISEGFARFKCYKDSNVVKLWLSSRNTVTIYYLNQVMP